MNFVAWLQQGKIMHPWTKAYRDVYTPDQLKQLYDLEKEMRVVAAKEALEKAFAKMDLASLVRDAYLDGFDSFEAYEKYGDLFSPVSPKKPTNNDI